MQSLCPYGVYFTDVVGGAIIDFQLPELSPGVSNPLSFNGTEWPTVSGIIILAAIHLTIVCYRYNFLLSIAI